MTPKRSRKAIEEAQAETSRPSLILVRTHIGYGSPKKQESFEAHGNPLGEEELQATKKALGWPTMDKFYLPEDAVAYFRKSVDKGARAQKRMAEEVRRIQESTSQRKPPNWSK